MKKIILFLMLTSLSLSAFGKKKMSAAQAAAIGKAAGEAADKNSDQAIVSSDNTNVNDQSLKSSSGNAAAGQMATLAGMALLASGKALSSNPYTKPAGVVLMMMGMLAGKQAGENYGVSLGAYGSAGQTDAGMGNGGTGGPDTSMDAFKNLPEVMSYNNNLKRLQNDPLIAYDAKAETFKLDGKTLKLSDLSSKSAMASAGIPSSLIDKTWSEAERISNEAEKKVAALGNNGAGGSGAGGGLGSGAFTDITVVDEGDMGADGLAGRQRNNGRDAQLRKPSGLAGMSKSYYGTPIGVAVDNIFLMMNRRYKVKDKQETFFSKTNAPTVPTGR